MRIVDVRLQMSEGGEHDITPPAEVLAVVLRMPVLRKGSNVRKALATAPKLTFLVLRSLRSCVLCVLQVQRIMISVALVLRKTLRCHKAAAAARAWKGIGGLHALCGLSERGKRTGN